MKRLFAGAAIAILVTACGSSDSDSGDSPQDQVADIVIQAASDAGASPDADCIREAASKIDTADAEALVEAGLDGDPTFSAETGEHLADMLLC